MPRPTCITPEPTSGLTPFVATSPGRTGGYVRIRATARIFGANKPSVKSVILLCLHGSTTVVQRYCNGIATVSLPWASRCPWEHYRSTTVAPRLQYGCTAVLLLLPPQPGDRLVHRFEDQAQECGQGFPVQALTPLADPFVEAQGWVRTGGPELGGDKLWDGLSRGRVRPLCFPKLDCPQPF